MRLHILILGFTFCINEVAAQTEKGNMSVGVSGLPLFFNSDETGLRFSGLALKGSYGIFLSNRLSLENNLFYYKNNDVFANGGKVRSESFGLQVSLRYHIPINENVLVFGDIGGGFGSVKYYDNYEYEFFSYSYYNSGIALYTIGMGSYIRLNKDLHFEFFIPFLVVHNTTNDQNIYGNERGSLLYGAIAGPNVGFRLFF